MKNIQVIDGALNCTFSIFQATDEEFALLFPEPRQDIQYAERLARMPGQRAINAACRRIWERPIRKQDAMGIHGTLFFELQRYQEWYPEDREDAVVASAINAAQRRLFRASSTDAEPDAPSKERGAPVARQQPAGYLHQVEIHREKRTVYVYRVFVPGGREHLVTTVYIHQDDWLDDTARHDSCARLLGEAILRDSPAGRELLGL